MSKEKDSVRRQLLVYNKVRQSRCAIPKDELLEYINRQLEHAGYDIISAKTLERDLCAIRDLFHIYISYDRSKHGYCITEDHSMYQDRINELLLNFDLLNSISRNPDLSSYVLAEHHRPVYSEWLAPLVTAIKCTYPVRFGYVNYRKNNEIKYFEVNPHYLKESNRRWYLLAYDDGIMKTFGVDRIRDLDIIDYKTFKRDTDIDVSQLFRDCYGIWDDESMPVEDIELRYDALDGNFLKSVPLHHSQQILADNDNEFRISLRLRITNDFVMELLSRSRSLEVIRPQHLRERIRKVYEEALRRNS